MRAFHSNWTAPFFARNPHAEYAVEPFELLTTALSALSWQRCGGTISMLCDSPAAAYYRACGLEELWDGGIQIVLDDIPQEINPCIFWAAGKLFALRTFGAPCVMLDTDFIVWKPLAPLLEGVSLAAIHREDILPDIYPDVHAFPAASGFDFSGLDWSVKPANTALSWFGDADFVEKYTARAIEFMRCCKQADNPLTYMVFAEQRLLAMLAQAQGVPLHALSDLPALFTSGQQYFTHVWGFKQQMRDNPALYAGFCKRCAARLQTDFPEWAAVLARIPSLSPYFS
ncbi:MAG: hypothetical protein ACI3XZ_03985 [Butyricicoccus sp.]